MSGQDLRSAIALVTLIGCGDNHPPSCDPEWQVNRHRISGCRAALLFSARDTADLLPSQGEVDRYLDRWQRTITAEPILAERAPQRYRRGVSVYTTNPQIIEPWSQGVLETGDVELDEMLARIGAAFVGGRARDTGAYHYAEFDTTHVFNEEFLAAALLVRSSWMNPPEVWPRDDGTWSWLDTSERAGHDDATAKIDFRFGWGDCFSGCLGFRDLQAIVPPEGPATVYDLGGDPLPPGWSLSPNTKPPP